MRTFVSVVAALSLAPAVHAQGPQIQHDAVGCVVAGQFPKLDACFMPVDVARARVYFKAIDGPHWYWVSFTPGTPCFNAVLPKPTKKIQQMTYYVEAADKEFHEARTADRVVDVVADAGGCKKDVPVAGWVPNATVTVGTTAAAAPVVPVGFAATSIVGGGAGIGAATVLVGVVGGGAAVGGAVAAASSGGGNNPTPTPAVGPSVAPTAGPTNTPTAAPAPTSTPLPPAPTPTPAPPFRMVVNAGPTSGFEPLLVTFDLCGSAGTNLSFGYDFDGDGIEDQRGPCRTSRTYTLSGVTFAPRAAARAGILRDYTARVRVFEQVGGGSTETATVNIHVDPVPPAGPNCSSSAAPAVTVTIPAAGAPLVADSSTPLQANATDSEGMASVQFKAEALSTPPSGAMDIGSPSPVSGSGPTFDATWVVSCLYTGLWHVWAVATDVCGQSTTSALVTVNVAGAPSCPFTEAEEGDSTVAWTSRLEMEDAAATLLWNSGVYAVPAGSSAAVGRVKPKDNKVTLVLHRGNPRGRVWRLDLHEPARWDVRTLRVLAGELLSVTESSVVFRLQGRPGERIELGFDSR